MRISDWSSDVCSSDLLTIPEARYKIIRQGAADVPELQGVRRKGAPPQQESAQGGVPSRFRLRINVKADNRIFVSGMGLESEWKSNVQVRGTTASPRLSGTLEVRSEEHTSELQSLMRISYAVFCLKKKKINVEQLQ